MSIFQNVDGFMWDSANQEKIWLKHKISTQEAEQPFFNLYLTETDTRHSQKEERFRLLGVTNLGKILLIVFTVRNKKIRIISARTASKKEKQSYEKATQKTAEV